MRGPGWTGQGVWQRPTLGGLGMISIWVTERAPWRIDVPTQSEPVSPPPMTTTSLPVARMPRCRRGWRRRRCAGSTGARKSMANSTPRASRPGMGRSRGERRAAGQHDRVELGEQLRGRGSRRRRGRRCGTSTPSSAMRSRRRSRTSLLELEVRDAVAQQAADAVGALEDRDHVPGAVELVRGRQAGRPGADDGHRPAGALAAGGRGSAQPSSKARSMIATSMFLMVDGGLVDGQDAGRLARRRADPAGELGEVVGRAERRQGLLPACPGRRGR